MSTYEPVMGLEIHVELNTKTKMFCRCSSDYFGKEPNTHTCPVCLGLPGALPYPNTEALKKCMQIGLALNCSVQNDSLFERKNYFYPDLAKGYQISQLRWPLNVNGSIEVEDKDDQATKIRINRVHQEEDTGKLTHQGSETLIDFNRAGVPLVEIVTEPDFTDPIQVRNYAKALQQIFRDLGVSNADMERGDMRLEANISVREKREGERGKELPNYRVELKNINSFRFMVAAIEYEIKRQIKALENRETLHQETRGWNESKQETFLQRSKEEANDYRYFPEPDLPRLEIDVSSIKNQKLNMPKLTRYKLGEWEDKYAVPKNSLASINADIRRMDLFQGTIPLAEDKNISVAGTAVFIANLPQSVLDIYTPIKVIADLTDRTANVVSDQAELEKLAQEVIDENPAGAVDSFKAGKEAAMGVLMGALMKKTAGKADPKVAREILVKLLT